MANIRISKTPIGVPTQSSPDYLSGMEAPDFATRRTLKAVPRDEANIEAEKGETVYMPNKGGLPAHFNIDGKRHYGGGTPLNVPKDSFVFSDTKKMRIKDPEVLAEFGKAKGSYTPADLAKKYDINKFRKILQDPDSDHIDITTAEKMIANYNLKLGKLALFQESKKGFPQGIPAVAMPFMETYQVSPEQILPLQAQGQQQPQLPQMRGGGSIPLPKAQNGFTNLQILPTLAYLANQNKEAPRDNTNMAQQIALQAQLDPTKNYFYDRLPQPAKSPHMVLSNAQVIQAAEDGEVPVNATEIDVMRIKRINPDVDTYKYSFETYKQPEVYKTLDKETQKQVYHDVSRAEQAGLPDPYTGYWDRVRNENVFMRNSDWNDHPYEADPRMRQAARRLVDHNEYTGMGFMEGVGVGVNNIFDLPRNEINNLLTGQYEGIGDTKARMDPNMTNAQRVAYNLIDPLPFKALLKTAGVRTAKTVLPKSMQTAEEVGRVLGRNIPKYTVKAAEKAVKGTKYVAKKTGELIEYIYKHFPDIAEGTLLMGSRALQEGTRQDKDIQPTTPVDLLPPTYPPKFNTNWADAEETVGMEQFRPYQNPQIAMPAMGPAGLTPQEQDFQIAQDQYRNSISPQGVNVKITGQNKKKAASKKPKYNYDF